MFRKILFIIFAVFVSLSFNDVSNAEPSTTQKKIKRRLATPSIPKNKIKRVDVVAKEKLKQRYLKVGASTSAAQRNWNVTRETESSVIPVYVHVISNPSNPNNNFVSNGTIEHQIQTLNEAYRGQYGGFGTPFKFELQDIIRTENSKWYNFGYNSPEETQAKKALRKGDAKTLNVYFVRPKDNYLGWSTYPWDYSANPLEDGIVINIDALPGSPISSFSEGKTLVHESGHWLGLYHTFEGGCTPLNDAIKDTPAEKNASYGCSIGRDSCTGTNFSGLDSIQNFMNYSDDSCMIEFTKAQALRVDILAQFYRGL